MTLWKTRYVYFSVGIEDIKSHDIKSRLHKNHALHCQADSCRKEHEWGLLLIILDTIIQVFDVFRLSSSQGPASYLNTYLCHLNTGINCRVVQ